MTALAFPDSIASHLRTDSVPKRLSLLGATGSIGQHCYELFKQHPERFDVVALTANHNVEALAEMAVALKAEVAVIADESRFDALKERLVGTGVEAAAGAAAIVEAASRPVEMVVAAICGFSGLEPTLAAIANGADVALANKECLVAAGPVFMNAVGASEGRLLPVDSEHNAIFQVLAEEHRAQLERVTLTASGGPFLHRSLATMAEITPKEAVAHPNWSMGAKISVDSATMMNKGLELIEAHYLFDLPAAQLDAIIHPESIIHSLVAYQDGSVLAQMGMPDMCTPIAVALAWPERLPIDRPRLDLAALGSLHFERPDLARFPCLRLALRAMEAGGSAPTVLNAANEVAVAAFLDGTIGYVQIPALVEQALSQYQPEAPASLEDVVNIDRETRRLVESNC